MPLTGEFLIAGQRRGAPTHFYAYDPARGEEIAEPGFAISTAADIADACAAAEAAACAYAVLPLEERAAFLDAMAEEIDALGDTLTERAGAETGLPPARLNGERGRTVGQLRLFAKELRDGAWQNLRIDHADPARTPPRPDLRLRTIPLGPVAVFGASNFPLAFSVAGGDTASALAAGCPVVVKGHPAHPGTSELVAGAIARAASRTGMPAGVFSLIAGPSHDIGMALVRDPRIQAVGFTGSRAGGMALIDAAAQRAQPIPVYAEMSAVNPVVLLPAALAARGAALGSAYVASVAMGAGQFCTNPGVILALRGDALDQFAHAAAAAVADCTPQAMLTPAIHAGFSGGRDALAAQVGVELLAEGPPSGGACQASPVIYRTSAARFLDTPALAEEIFGAASLIVACDDIDQLETVLRQMEGQLTATLHMDEDDHDLARRLLPVLERRAGRILANGWPTGVEVTHAMVHGGPWPATSDARSTSVGTGAIDRFLRPVCYQDLPDAVLPEPLREGHSQATLRRVDGAWTL